MSEEMRSTLLIIMSGQVYSNGTIFRYHGFDLTAAVQAAVDAGYAGYNPELAWQAVELTKSGREAVRQ